MPVDNCSISRGGAGRRQTGRQQGQTYQLGPPGHGWTGACVRVGYVDGIGGLVAGRVACELLATLGYTRKPSARGERWFSSRQRVGGLTVQDVQSHNFISVPEYPYKNRHVS